MHLLQQQSLRQTLRAGARFRRVATALLLVLTLALPASADKAKRFLRQRTRRRGAAELGTGLRILQTGLRSEAQGTALPERRSSARASRRRRRTCTAGSNCGTTETCSRRWRSSCTRRRSIRRMDIAQQEIRRTREMIEQRGAQVAGAAVADDRPGPHGRGGGRTGGAEDDLQCPDHDAHDRRHARTCTRPSASWPASTCCSIRTTCRGASPST